VDLVHSIPFPELCKPITTPPRIRRAKVRNVGEKEKLKEKKNPAGLEFEG